MSVFTLRKSWALSRISATAAVLTGAGLLAALPVTTAHAVGPAALAAVQAVPGHTRLVPDVPRSNTPNIPNGEIWDMEVVGNRVFIAGSFTSIKNTTGNGTSYNQRWLASYNLDTGLVDANFRPTFDGGGHRGRGLPRRHQALRGRHVQHRRRPVERKVGSINLTTGAAGDHLQLRRKHQQPGDRAGGRPTRRSTSVAASPRSTTSRRRGLAAVNATTGAVDPNFTNNIEGGVGAQRRAHRPAAQAHPRRDQAARRAHRPADQRSGPVRRRR